MITLAALALLTLPAAGAGPTPPPPAAAAACPSGEAKPDPAKLTQRIESMMEGKSTQATVTMTIKSSSSARSLKMKMWSKGDDYALIRVLEGGPREIGMMTLKREKQLWNWLPKAGRVMKLPSGMLGDSWMGSDFSNDDLVHGSSMANDFAAVVDDAAADAKTWHLTLTPKASATVVWSKIVVDVDRATCLPVSEVFFDDAGKQARKMTLGDIKDVGGGRKFPMTLTVAGADDAGKSTTLHYDDIQFDADIPDDTFSLHRLEQGR